MRLLMLLPAAMLAACTPTPKQRAIAAQEEATTQQKLDKALVGLTPGKPVSCIDQFQSRQMSGYGQTILYKVSSKLVYRTETSGLCNGIGRGDILVTRTTTGQLCRGDIARTVDSASRFPTGSCSFGDFTPYRKR